MTNIQRPTFVMTNGQRNGIDEGLFVDDIEERYRLICQSRFKWSGLPEDVPDGWVEKQLFDYGGISAKDVPGLGICLFAVAPSYTNIYGQPVRWLPTGVKGIESYPDMYRASDNPVLWMGISTHDLIYPYVETMKQIMRTLYQNVIALSQPVLVEGIPGNELNGKMMTLDLKTGKTFIPVVDKQLTGLEILDLKAQDHTQNLYSSYQNMHDTIMSLIGLMNGNNKTSGVNPVEQIADTQEISMTIDYGLEIRKRWCDEINAVLGTEFSVELSDEWELPDVRDIDIDDEIGGDDDVNA